MVASMKVLHIVKTAVGATWAYEQVGVLCSLGVVIALPSDTEGLAPKYRQTGATVVRAKLDLLSVQSNGFRRGIVIGGTWGKGRVT
jgi:hypothetical protein